MIDDDTVNSAEREMSIRELERLGNGAVTGLPTLIRALDDPSAPIRAMAARAIGRLGSAGMPAMDALKKTLHDQRGNCRLAAAEAIWRVSRQTEECVPVLLQTAKRQSPQIQGLINYHRILAIHTLAEIACFKRQSMDELRGLLEDPDERVREAASASLARIEAELLRTW
jgi:hypothetical protein